MNSDRTPRLAAAWAVLSAHALKWRAVLHKPTVQRWVFALAVLVFGAGLGLSINANPSLVADLDPCRFFLLVFVFAPVVILINTQIMRETACNAGVDFNFKEAAKITVLSSAANHLPLPGGLALRILAMKEKGASYTKATAASFAAGVLWLGLTLIYAGVWAIASNAFLAVLMIGAGVCAAVAGATLSWRVNSDVAALLRLCFLSGLLAVWYSAGIFLSLATLGVEASFAIAAVISAAGVIGAAASIVPAGMGVREAAAASLAIAVTVDPSTGFASVALAQIALMVILALGSLLWLTPIGGMRSLKS